MSLIPWDKKFKLGIKEIDDQHRQLLGIINRLYDLFKNDKHEDLEGLGQIIKEITDYSVYHFRTEEKYFKRFNYAKAAEHIKMHDQYLAKIEEWHRRYHTERDSVIFFEISNFLHKWWTYHINNADRDYVPFLEALKDSEAERLRKSNERNAKLITWLTIALFVFGLIQIIISIISLKHK
jgi:hemerythrin-like metal-binding protein